MQKKFQNTFSKKNFPKLHVHMSLYTVLYEVSCYQDAWLEQ